MCSEFVEENLPAVSESVTPIIDPEFKLARFLEQKTHKL